MPSRKRAASSSLQYPRRSRRISCIPRKLDAVASIDDGNASLDGTDENAFYSTDDDYRSEEEDPGSEQDDDDDISPSEKVIKEKKDTDEDEDEKRVVTVIPHEILRPLDGVEYADHKTHKNTLLYLKDLRVNNTRSWFKNHEKELRRASKDWETFVETITPKVIGFDSTIPELPPKDFIFRIYRDVRFSKDQRPYKTHFSAAFSRTGRQRRYACYYIHLDPGASYVGGGLWAPEPPTIQLLRESIEQRPEDWRQLLASERFMNTFLPKAEGSAESALKAFADENKEGSLKTRPKGYDTHHRDIQLLKLRNYHVVKKVDDAIFTAEDGQERIINIISILQPFVTFLNEIIMPDPDRV